MIATAILNTAIVYQHGVTDETFRGTLGEFFADLARRYGPICDWKRDEIVEAISTGETWFCGCERVAPAENVTKRGA